MDIIVAIVGTFILSSYFFTMKHRQDNFEISKLIGDLIREMDEMAKKQGYGDFSESLLDKNGSIRTTQLIVNLEKTLKKLSK